MRSEELCLEVVLVLFVAALLSQRGCRHPEPSAPLNVPDQGACHPTPTRHVDEAVPVVVCEQTSHRGADPLPPVPRSLQPSLNQLHRQTDPASVPMGMCPNEQRLQRSGYHMSKMVYTRCTTSATTRLLQPIASDCATCRQHTTKLLRVPQLSAVEICAVQAEPACPTPVLGSSSSTHPGPKGSANGVKGHS